MSWRVTVTSESHDPRTNTWRKHTTKYGPYLTQDGAVAEVRAAVEHHREAAPGAAPARVVAVVEEPTAAHVAEVTTFRFYEIA